MTVKSEKGGLLGGADQIAGAGKLCGFGPGVIRSDPIPGLVR